MLHLAGCVIVDEHGHILLIHRNTDTYKHWEIPGGKIDEGEAPREAAIRELREELGVEVAATEHIGAFEFVDRGKHMRYNFFAAAIMQGEPRIMEPRLHDSVRYIDVAAGLETSYSLAAQRFIEELAAGRIEMPSYTCE